MTTPDTKIGANAVYLCPGQGAQNIGMGKALAEANPQAAALIERAEIVAGFPMAETINRGPAKLLTRTDILQPSVCVVSATALSVLASLPLSPAVIAGHSLGELTACYAAGAFDFDTLVRLAATRGKLMQQTADKVGGGMMALTSRDDSMPDAAHRLLAELDVQDVCVANENSPRQAVLSGSEAGLAQVADKAQSMALRATRLRVSGPWHSPAMRPAAEAFGEALEKATIQNTDIPVLSAYDARQVTSATDLRHRLMRLIDQPLHWLSVMQTLLEQRSAEIWVEVAPGKILTGLLLETDRTAQIYRSETPAQLARLEQSLAADTASSPSH